MTDLPDDMRLWRRGLGLTQKSAAQALGYSTRTIQRLEHDAKPLRPAIRYIMRDIGTTYKTTGLK